MRGLLKEALSLLGWIAAFVVANAYGAKLAVLLPEVIPGSTLRLIVGFIVLFIGTRLLMSLLTMAVDSVVTASGFKMIDRGLGGLFGLGRGIVIVLAVALLCSMTSIPQQSFWTDALLSPLVESAAHTAQQFLPGDIVRHVKF